MGRLKLDVVSKIYAKALISRNTVHSVLPLAVIITKVK